jgi:hypothetical protein
MEYFREMLLNCTPHTKISTLLMETRLETSQSKTTIPPLRGRNYVDDTLNEYSVKMYSYPDLTSTDSKLAFNIYSQRKNKSNIFQLDEVRRKPLKKKLTKKAVMAAPMAGETQPCRSCPCCGGKLVGKHKCEHTYCQKPCTLAKKVSAPLPITPTPEHSHEGAAEPRKKKAAEEEGFEPEKEELENE